MFTTRGFFMMSSVLPIHRLCDGLDWIFCFFLFYKNVGPLPLRKSYPYREYITSTNKQLENIRIDPKFVELTADVLNFF